MFTALFLRMRTPAGCRQPLAAANGPRHVGPGGSDKCRGGGTNRRTIAPLRSVTAGITSRLSAIPVKRPQSWGALCDRQDS